MTDPLLEPYTLRHLTLRNRIISTAHAPSFVEEGHPRKRYRLYHEEKAKGGLAMTIVGGSTNIAADSPSVFGQLYAGDDSIVPLFQQLTAGVKQHGAAILCQITHMGRRTAWDDGDWLPVISPSAVRERAHRSHPKAMEDEDIERVIADFVAAAKRCQAGGFDGIEVLSHSHLLGQFMSPLVNRRSDDYGGSLANRLRLTHRVLSAIRAEVGDNFIVGIRLTADELTASGLTPEDGIAAARSLSQSGEVDFFNVLAGAPYDDLGLAGWVSPMGMPAAPHLEIAGTIRQVTGVTTLHAGGIADLATARHALKGGHVDLVGMTRAHLADPHLVNKLSRKAESQIRPCVGLGYCVDRVNQGKSAVCGHNPATGREATLKQQILRADTKRRVVVVGGGPGGLEAARVCAERGHDVTLFEATGSLGGQLQLAGMAPHRHQIHGVIAYLKDELDRLAVNVQYNTLVDGDLIRATSADAVILATGGWPGSPDVAGGMLAHSSHDVLTGDVRPSGSVLLYDEDGDQPAAVVASVLADQGCAVELVTPDRTVLQNLGPTNAAVALRALAQAGVKTTTLHEFNAITRSGAQLTVTLRHVLTGALEEREVEHAVVEKGCEPTEDLYFELKPQARNLGQLDMNALVAGENPFRHINPDGQFLLARIGDAVASRNLHAALLDARRICQSL